MVGAVWSSEEDWIGEKGFAKIYSYLERFLRQACPVDELELIAYVTTVSQAQSGHSYMMGRSGDRTGAGGRGGAAVARPFPIHLPRVSLPLISICEALQLQPEEKYELRASVAITVQPPRRPYLTLQGRVRISTPGGYSCHPFRNHRALGQARSQRTLEPTLKSF